MTLIPYGKILRKHGLYGELKVLPFSGELGNFKNFKSLFISFDKEKRSKFIIKSKKYIKNHAIVKLEGIDTPEEANRFLGYTVFVESSELQKLGEDEYYWHQLIGLKVFTTENIFVGNVTSLIDNTAQPILIIRNNDNEMMIPMVDKFVMEIDINNSKIVINPVENPPS